MNHNIFLVLALICFGIVGYMFFFKPYPEIIQNPEIMEEKNIEMQEKINENFPIEDRFDIEELIIVTEEEGNCVTNCYNNTCETSCL